MKSFEPNLHHIDDYNGNESREKRKTIRLVVVGLLLAGGVYAGFHHYFGTVEDQIPEAPYLLKRF
jgi:hypothetical protein